MIKIQKNKSTKEQKNKRTKEQKNKSRMKPTIEIKIEKKHRKRDLQMPMSKTNNVHKGSIPSQSFSLSFLILSFLILSYLIFYFILFLFTLL